MEVKMKDVEKIIKTAQEGKKYFCVVSHTHWDREWYMPFEQFRIRLVELMDRLFSILEKNPAFIFHLDAQTIVLEDYLEIRPWRRKLLEKHIFNGNLVVGPWYLQNDFYLTSGEATIRNLLIGTSIAEKFGRCGKAGYAPDQFGNISQLPQILSQFGIDNFIFGRGYGSYEKSIDGLTVRENAPTEFIWEGPDGSRILAIHMKYWYNNAQRLYSDIEKTMPLLDTIENLFEGVAITPYILLMNGVDHLEAQDDLLPIIDRINEKFESQKSEDKISEIDKTRNIQQYKMYDYIKCIRNHINENNTDVRIQKGELRDGHDWELLKGTLSSRVYLKQQNVKAQIELENYLEPMSSLYELAGAKGSYDNDYMRYLWKQLLKNHPHDSICGCSRDEVHDHMEDNYKRIEETASYLLNKKSHDIANHMEVNTRNHDDNIIALANTISIQQSDVLEVELMFLRSENVDAFIIEDMNGEKSEFVVTKTEFRLFDVFTALNLPGVLDVKVFTILLSTRTVEGFALKGLMVRKTNSFEEDRFTDAICSENHYINKEVKTAGTENDEICNEKIRVSVNIAGEITVEFMETGKVLSNAILIEELPDRGDAYVFFKTDDIPYYATNFPASISCIEKNYLQQKISISYAMILPVEYDFPNRKRSSTRVLCPVELTLILKKGSDILEIGTNIQNTVKDHRIRLLIDTGIYSNESIADIPFDIVTRDINPRYPDTMSDVHPATSFAAIINRGNSNATNPAAIANQEHSDKSNHEQSEKSRLTQKSIDEGIAIFNTGSHEYEHLIDKQSTLAFTLVRSTGVISMGADLTPGGGEQWNVPGNQCLRVLDNRFGLHLFQSSKIADLPARALAFRAPIKATFTSCDDKKFAGGRFAIQGSSVEEFYYLPDLHPSLEIKDNISIVKVQGEGIMVTALKKSENKDAFVLRIVNMNEVPAPVLIKFDGIISKSILSEVSADLAGEGEVVIDIKPKEIATYMLQKRPV